MKFMTWKINMNGSVKWSGNEQSHQINSSRQVSLLHPFDISIEAPNSGISE